MKICLSVVDPIDIDKANKSKADILELRTDLYKNFDLKDLISKCRKPVIVKVTNKKILQQALQLKPEYIDVDYKSNVMAEYYSTSISIASIKLMISYHNFLKTPDFKFLDNLVKQGINKIAVKINKIEDNLVIAKLLKKYPNKIIAIGMGELGIMTRLDKRNMISYFVLDKNKQSAPGQLTIDQVDIKLYGIIGNPAKHSLSPKIHNPKFKKNKIKALYQIWETQDLRAMMQIFREFNLAGASVTIPYKEQIIKYLDGIDKIIRKIGAVNTIVSKSGKLFGYNTDWYGVVKAVCNCKSLRGKKAVILGRGGAAKAAKYGLEKYGANVQILHRGNIKNFNEKFDILINATPVYNKMLLDKKLISKNCKIMDMIYHRKTKLLQIAKQKRAVAINGLTMLKYQGELQFYLWTKIRENYHNIKLS